MQMASSSNKELKSFTKKFSKTPAKAMESKDYDIFQKAGPSSNVIWDDAKESEQSLIADDTSNMCGDNPLTGEEPNIKDVNEFLKGKVGVDINAKKWLEGCEGLENWEKSEVIIRLVYEVCLAKNIEYDLENESEENEKENNKGKSFDTRRIFEILKKLNRLLLPQDRRRLVEFICQNGNAKLLKMICQQENKDGGSKTNVNKQYSWKGEFTGYKPLTDLLQYVLNQQCSPEIVQCVAEKVYGGAHIFYNGQQYLNDLQVARVNRNFDYTDSVIKDCLKAAIESGYADVLGVMLSGDIYQCIRLMKNERFQEEERFCEILGIVENAVADLMSSWVKEQSYKKDLAKEVKGLLKEGIEVNIDKMGKQDLIDELEDLGIDVKDQNSTTRKELVKMLRAEKRGKVRLRKTIIGALISTLIFNYQAKFMEILKGEKPFELKLSSHDKWQREKEIDELNEHIDSRSFLIKMVSEKIKLLNSSSHMSNNWFFREVLENIVNDNLDELNAFCASICKEPMEKFLKNVEVQQDVVDILGVFGVEPKQNKASTSKKGHSRVSIVSSFSGDIENLVKNIKELEDPSLIMDEILDIASGLASGKVPAFSGLSRREIINLKNKKDKTPSETKDLKTKVIKVMAEIKEGIDILAKSVNSEYHIDIEDVFKHFKIINSEIENENKREIVKFICKKNNVLLLEMICKEEVKRKGHGAGVDRQYPWKGDFTGYDTLTKLLQYVLQQQCSSEIVLCIANKVYGGAHTIYCGEQYLDKRQISHMKENFDCPDSVAKDCLLKAIEFDYADVLGVMISGDVYQCIRLMKNERFQEDQIFKDALDMIENAVAKVMSSWVKEDSCKQDLLKEIKSLLKKGIEVNIDKMGKQDLMNEIESLGIELSRDDKRKKEKLVEKLKKEGGGKIRLRKTVVGAVIWMFFNHQNQSMEALTEKMYFELKLSACDKCQRENEIKEFNKNFDNKNFVKKKVLEKIKLLNLSSHMSNNWFFREVLEEIFIG